MAKIGAKYKWDEKKKDFVEVEGSYEAAKKTSNKSYEKTGVKKDGVIIDPEWERYVNGITAQFATEEQSKVPNQLTQYQSKINSDLYKPGAGATLAPVNYQLGKIGRDTRWRQQFIKDTSAMLGLSEEEVDKMMSSFTEDAEAADALGAVTAARTGDTSVLAGKKGQEARDLKGLNNLYGYDVNTPGLMQKNNAKSFEEMAERTKNFNLQDALLTVEDYYRMVNSPVMGDGLSAARVDKADYDRAAEDIQMLTGINVRDLAPDQVQSVLEQVGGMSDTIDYMQSYVRYNERQNQEQAKQAEYDDFVSKSYAEATADPEFAALSQFDETETSPLYKAVMLPQGSKEQQQAVTDLGYDWNMRINGIMPLLGRDTEDSYGFEFMSPQQREEFAYRWKKNGSGDALQYLNDISWGVNKQRMETEIQQSQEFADDGFWKGAAASADSVARNFAGELEGLYNIGRKAMGIDINEYDTSFLNTVKGQTERQTVGENIAENTQKLNLFGKNVPQMAYNALMSAADSTLNAMTLGSAASPMMGAGAFNASFQQNLADGKSDQDAFIDALVEGGIEMGTEYFSIEALMSDTSSPLGYFLRNLITEPSEEITGFAAGEIYDNLKNGADSRVNQRIDELKTMGYSPEDAKAQATRELLTDLFETGFTAFLSGGTMGAVGAVNTAVQNNSAGKNIQSYGDEAVKSLLDTANTLHFDDEIQGLIDDQLAALNKDSDAATADQSVPSMENMRTVQDEETRNKLKEKLIEEKTLDPKKDAKREKADAKAKEAEQITRSKGGVLSPAKIGRIFRETMKAVDENAQQVIQNTTARYVAGELQKNGVDDPAMTDAVVRIVSDNGSAKPEDYQRVTSSRGALAVVEGLTGRINDARNLSQKAARIAEQAAKKNKPAVTEETTDTPAAPDTVTDNVNEVVSDTDELPEGIQTDEQLTGEAARQHVQESAAEYTQNPDLVVNAYEEGQDPVTFSHQFQQAYQYGEEGRNFDIISKSSSFSGIKAQQIEKAYMMGRDARIQRAQKAAQNRKGLVKVGNIDTSEIRGMKLNEVQQKGIDSISRLAKAVGFNVKFTARTFNADGKANSRVNGSWDKATRTITIDINAGRLTRESANYAMMQTAGHELTHFIKEFADTEMFSAYQDFVFGHLSEKMTEAELDDKVADYIKRWSAQGKAISRDQAIEEIVADASGDALLKMTEADIQQLAEQNPSLLKKIGEFIQKWVKDVKALIEGVYSGQKVRTAIADQMVDVVDELGAKWTELLKNAAMHARAVKGESIPVDAQGEVQFSLQEDERLMHNATVLNSSKGNVPAKGMEKAAAARAEVAAFMRDDSRTLNLPEDIMGNTFFSDAAYGGTEENTTVCPRSIGADAFLDAVSDKIGRPLTVAEQVRISQDVIGAADIKEPQCIYCYVAADRAAYREFLGKYIDQRDKVIEALKNGETDTKALYETFLAGRKDTPNMKKRFKLWVDSYQQGKRLLSASDLANIGVLTAIQSDKYRQLSADPNFAAQMKDALAYAQSASWAKKRVNYVAYNGHILKWGQNRINKLNSMYGLRMYSFSDFSPAFALENMQMVTDASVRGLKMLAYTKVPAFAEIFASTGMNINVSVFATEVQGDNGSSIVENNLMGADWKAAQKLRSEHENIGITFVATSDAQVEWALAQDWIDVCIPYHLVRTGRTIAEIMKYKNFTAESGDTKKVGWSKAAGNLSSIPAALHNNDRDTYMRLLEENNLEPRFARFADNPNYMKLVNETRQSVTTSKPVQPIFNTEAAINALQDMANNGGYYVPIGGSEQRMYELADEFAGKVTSGEYGDVSSGDDVMYSVEDAEYMEAYEAGDDYRAREIIHNAAIAAGYNPMKLYHGTTSFGFTKIDPAKSDDGISFFVSADDLVAETYVGKNAKIRRIGTDAMTVDKLLTADGEMLLSLLKKHVDEAYQLVDKDEVRELVGEEGELIRKRIIPQAEALKTEYPDIFAGKTVNDAFDAVIDALDRLSYANAYDIAEDRYIAYDDALRDLKRINADAASVLSYAIGGDVYQRYNCMQDYLGGDVFKIEDEWGFSTDYTFRRNVIDELMPKLFSGIYELYGKTDNLFEVNAYGGKWNRIDGSVIGQKGYVTTREVSAYAKANGYDGVYFHDIVDVGGLANYSASSDVLTFFHPEDLKSADPYTYDDDGNVIPPSKRFDRNNNDIRYSIAEDTEGHKVVVVENDILKGIYSGGKWTPEQKRKAKKAARDAITAAGPIYSEGIPFYITSKTRDEFPSSEYVWETLGKKKQKLADRFRASSETENLIMATAGWTPDPLKKPRKDFVRFVKGTVYMAIGGRKYTGVVKAGVTPAGEHVLYDLVEMDTAHFDMRKEGNSSATQVKALAPYSELPSTDGIIAQPSEESNAQIQDPDQITDRELLSNVMESAATNDAELDHVRRYRKRIAALNEKQAALEETNQAIVNARKAGKRADAAALQNKADILAKQIAREDGMLLKFEAGKPLQAVVQRERAALKRKADERVKAYAAKRVETVKKQEAEKREKLNQKLAEVREKRDQKLAQLRQEKQEAVKKVREEKDESFGKDKYRKRITEDVNTLRTWVTSPTNKEHVPQFLRKPLGDLINALDFSSARSLKGGEATQNDAKLAAALDAMNVALSQLREQQNGIDQGAASFATIIDLPFGYHEAFIQLTADIKTRMETTKTTGDIPINRMTAAQLKELSVAIRTLTTSIRQMNRLLANAKYDSAVNAANSTIDELGKMTAKKLTYKAVDAVGKFMDWTNTVPYYAFKRFGKGGMAIFDGLMNGWDKLAFNSDKLVKFANDTYKPKEVKKWSSEIRSVDLSNGETVQMTTAQLMSLYCLSKRAQAVGHLLGGGIRIADIESKGRKLTQSDNYTLTEADLRTFEGMLTDRQRHVADELQHFMSTQGAEWGNEVSMKRFGYEMFTERFYFPIETDSNNRKAVDEQAEETSLFRLLNMSATKALVKNANNALVVRDIFDVFTAHSSDMAKYNALGLEILDALKWLNYVERTQNDDGTVVTRSVQKSLERAYGKDARQYIIQLIRDLNGVKEGGNDAGFMNKLVSNSKVASVANNIRVWLLQATSMPRAAYAINPKYLSIGLAKMAVNPRKAVKTAEGKVGIAKWKSMGFYDTNISRTVREMIKHDDNIPDKIRKGTMAPAGLMDSLTMGALYYAAEAECKKKYRNTPVGSEAWDKLVNDRMREIVYQTQVVDSTMTRSAAMRSQNSLLKTATSFMSEPTLTMNMLMDSVYEARMNRRAGESLKAPTAKMVKAMAVYTFTAVLVAAMESAFDAERDDDEYETLDDKFITAFIGDLTENDSGWERFTKLLFSNVGANLNPLNNIPVISEFMSIGEGYDSTSMWSQWFGNLLSGYKAYNRWREGKGTWYSWVYSGLKGLSQAFGLPASNTAREVVSVWNTFFADQYDMPRIQTYSNNKGDAAEAYYEAITSGDSERAAYILKRAQINGISEDSIGGSIATYVKNDYVAGNITEAVARKYLAQYAGKSADKIDGNIKEWTYQRETGYKYDDMKADYISGEISKSQMQQLLMQYRGYDSDEVYFKLSEWDYEKTTGNEGGKYDWFLDAVDSGSGYGKYAQDLLNHGVDKSDIARSISGAYKDAYLAIKGTPEGDRMLEYLLDVYESIGYDREYERKYIAKNWK